MTTNSSSDSGMGCVLLMAIILCCFGAKSVYHFPTDGEGADGTEPPKANMVWEPCERPMTSAEIVAYYN
jgi:hypothetical protein